MGNDYTKWSSWLNNEIKKKVKTSSNDALFEDIVNNKSKSAFELDTSPKDDHKQLKLTSFINETSINMSKDKENKNDKRKRLRKRRREKEAVTRREIKGKMVRE